MSAASARGRALLAMDEPDPFILVECRRVDGVLGFEISWGDQIDDEDVPEVLRLAVEAMRVD